MSQMSRGGSPARPRPASAGRAGRSSRPASASERLPGLVLGVADLVALRDRLVLVAVASRICRSIHRLALLATKSRRLRLRHPHEAAGLVAARVEQFRRELAPRELLQQVRLPLPNASLRRGTAAAPPAPSRWPPPTSASNCCCSFSSSL